ncbi:class I SAM-dependent methyltransferase [Hyphococcus sp.]|uniref:class I SAM-dependent methyltransferase n=1 Tax=Hyphococcus sp. TaxID=2038636 RepID=UPI003CCBE219
MTVKDWDALADDFSARVLEISECDIDGVLQATAKRLGGARKIATDFGCGAGALTRLISPYFKSVIGVDFAPKLIEAARARTSAKNIEYDVCDLQAARAKRFPCDVAFCANVLIGEDLPARERIARNVVASLRKGGWAVFIVPSLEAVMRAYQVALNLRISSGAEEAAAERELDGWAADEVVSLPCGVIKMGGVQTKHFLEDEIAEFLTHLKLREVVVSRISYPWREALPDAPVKLRAAPPWDWMALGRKI